MDFLNNVMNYVPRGETKIVNLFFRLMPALFLCFVNELNKFFSKNNN